MTKKKTKQKAQVPEGNIYIQSSFNNLIITLTDKTGNVIAWSSAGSSGFKGTKKSTPYAATQAAKQLIEKAKERKVSKAAVFVSGIGSGRESAVRALSGSGINITAIRDITPMPHNGPRPKKPRRV